MVTERTIINALIIMASLVLAPFIVSESLSVDYLPLLVFAGAVSLIISFFFLKERLSMCPLLGGAVAGTLNFLPLPLKWGHIACIMLILYFVTGHVIIRQKKIKLGKPDFLWPMVLVVSIVFYHNHALKVGALGGDTEGGKPAILIYLVFIAYFCAINLTTPSVRFLSRIPLYFLILTALSSIPYLLSTYIPALAPYLYIVTDSVNVDAYVDTLGGTDSGAGEGVIGKLVALGPIGFSLQAYLLCHYPMGTWLRPDRWWVACLSLFCLILQVACGYRSEMFGYALLLVVGAWCYHSWRALVLPATVIVVALTLVAATTNNVIHLPVNKLPLIAQRTLSFIPADWDQEAIDSGKGSNEFRKNIEDVYVKEYMKTNPLLGNGFSINTKEFQYWDDTMKSGGGMDPEYVQAKLFIEGKMYHTGWISVYDCVGIVGFVGFIILAWNEIRATGVFIFGAKADRRSTLFPLYVWLYCQMVTMMSSYFAVFGSFQDTFTGLIIYAMLLSHLYDISNRREVPIVLPEREPVGLGQLSEAGYGYHSRS